MLITVYIRMRIYALSYWHAHRNAISVKNVLRLHLDLFVLVSDVLANFCLVANVPDWTQSQSKIVGSN